MDSKMDEHCKTRRRHSAEFKSEVVNACGAPGASVAGVALAYGVNANLVRQWLRGRGFQQSALVVPAPAVPAPRAIAPTFVPLALPPTLPAPQPNPIPAAPDIRIEVRRGGMQLSVSWPQSVASDCGAWLRELLR